MVLVPDGSSAQQRGHRLLYLNVFNAEDEDKIYILHHPIRKNDVSDL